MRQQSLRHSPLSHTLLRRTPLQLAFFALCSVWFMACSPSTSNDAASGVGLHSRYTYHTTQRADNGDSIAEDIWQNLTLTDLNAFYMGKVGLMEFSSDNNGKIYYDLSDDSVSEYRTIVQTLQGDHITKWITARYEPATSTTSEFDTTIKNYQRRITGTIQTSYAGEEDLTIDGKIVPTKKITSKERFIVDAKTEYVVDQTIWYAPSIRQIAKSHMRRDIPGVATEACNMERTLVKFELK
jgi:hypothetical protein